jgi:hypothetical protein
MSDAEPESRVGTVESVGTVPDGPVHAVLCLEAARRSAQQSAELANFPSDGFDIPGLSWPRYRSNKTRPRVNPGPKVSFASRRWGTEPEGWYVDLPYAVFDSRRELLPLECAQLIATFSSCQSSHQRRFLRLMASVTGALELEALGSLSDCLISYLARYNLYL